MQDNLFSVLGIQSREDSITNALAYSFNTSNPFRRHFLQDVCGKTPDQYDSAYAYTRVSTGSSGIPDIVIVLTTSSNSEIIVIENKITADEGNDQTKNYTSTDAIKGLESALLEGKPVRSSTFVFLTLFPDQEPAAGNIYRTKHHSDLKMIVDKISDWDNALAEQLMKDWVALVDDFSSMERVFSDDRFFEKLSINSDLDGGYLYFRSAIAQLNLPSDLAIEEFFRSSAQGRRFYGAKISKETWHPAEMAEVSNKWRLDGRQNFNIHFEPQYNTISGIFSFYLHYEVNPYCKEAWVRANIPKDQYDSYLDCRNAFSEQLRMKNLPGWYFGGGSNQIAKATFDFTKSSYDDVKTILEETLKRTALAIDAVIDEMS